MTEKKQIEWCVEVFWLRECEELSSISYCKSVLHLVSSSGQLQVVSAEAVVRGTVVDRNDDDEEVFLCLFGNITSFRLQSA